jgi:hypothetical protein
MHCLFLFPYVSSHLFKKSSSFFPSVYPFISPSVSLSVSPSFPPFLPPPHPLSLCLSSVSPFVPLPSLPHFLLCFSLLFPSVSFSVSPLLGLSLHFFLSLALCLSLRDFLRLYLGHLYLLISLSVSFFVSSSDYSFVAFVFFALRL